MEKWLTIRAHPNYEVSNHGMVRNKRNGHVLKPVLNREGGYYRVDLDGTCYYVHRLVADAFLDGHHKGMRVRFVPLDRMISIVRTVNVKGNLAILKLAASNKSGLFTFTPTEKVWRKPKKSGQKPTFENGFGQQKLRIYAGLRALWPLSHFFPYLIVIKKF